MPNIFLRPLSLIVLAILLSSCKSPIRTVPIKSLDPEKSEQKAKNEVQQLHQCQQELKALNTLQANGYADLQRTFDTLMHGAAQYASLRKNVNENTQDTVDALYHYRVNLLCRKINQAVLNRLAEQGGTTP